MTRTSKIIIVSVAVMFIGGALHAAGQTVIRSPFNWSGAYIGAFAAHSWFDLHYDEPDWPGFERNPGMQGFFGGALLGYNYQVDSIVAGSEADSGWGNIREGASDSPPNSYSAFNIKWNGHVRARLGFLTGSTLLYLACGMALADVIVDDTDPAWGRDTGMHIGWTAGTGIEYGVTEKLRARFEYLHDDYGRKDYSIHGIGPYKARVALTAETLRAGLAYNF